MKKELFFLIAECLMVASCCDKKLTDRNYPINSQSKIQWKPVEEVSFQHVVITDKFWRPRIDRTQLIGIRHALKECSNALDNFDIAAGKKQGNHLGNTASDSDVYKLIQGAAYSLYNTPDRELEAIIDSIIDRIVAAQQPDGYLNTYWTINDFSKRLTDISRGNELYCAGHMFEAAVAYYQVIGKRKFLDAAIRYADYINSVFGPDKRLEVPGHEEIELALIKLYKATREKKYLDLSTFFVDERGDPKRMIVDKITPPDKDPYANTPRRWRPPSYMQDHLPVTLQYYAVGHAVRAVYLYTAMAGLSIESKTIKYLPALDSIWNDIVSKKLYVTGGIGTRQFHDEGFGSAYLLPSDRAYCETCSSIGLTFWNRMMNLLYADSKYADLIELTMYNAALAGVSLSGDRFFYTNPLESNGKYSRQPWFDPPCCPTNIIRFLPEIGSTIYSKTDKDIYINQFIGNEAKIAIGEKKVSLKLETDYPWGGKIKLKIFPETPMNFTLRLRIPGWTNNGELLSGGFYHFINLNDNAVQGKELILKVNGKTISKIIMGKGYAVIQRKWFKGDSVELDLPMQIKLLEGDPRVEDTNGKVVIMRGPLVYCVEETDNKPLFQDTNRGYLLPYGFKAEYNNDLLDGIIIIRGKVSVPERNEEIDITAVPYYAWCNREQGRMKIWLPSVK